MRSRLVLVTFLVVGCGGEVVDADGPGFADGAPGPLATPEDPTVIRTGEDAQAVEKGPALSFEWEASSLESPMIGGGGISTDRSYRGSAELAIEVPVAGRWRLTFRAENPTGSKNAFRLSTTETRFKNSRPKESAFSRQVRLSKKDIASDDFSRTAIELHLAAGLRTLRIDKMQAGLVLDAGRLALMEAADVSGRGEDEVDSDEESGVEPAPGPPVIIPPLNPDPDRPWENLLSSRVGFGAAATGGQGGELCVVTSLDDNGPDTLRECVARDSKGDRAVWAVFGVDGTITLDSPLRLGSNTTIDGRDAMIRIRRHGLAISKDSNVILHNIELSDIRGTDDSDALTVYASSNVWVDHVSFSNSTDGLLDITKGSREVTVSWCRFENQNKTMLIGANPNHVEDKGTRVTLHHNYYYRTTRRNPFLRHGKVHAFNNVFREWGEGNGGDLVAVTFEAQFNAENNVFDAGTNKRGLRLEVGSKNSVAGFVSASGSLLLNDAEFFENEPARVFDPAELYDYALEAADDELIDRVVAFAGRLASGEEPMP